ncbi:MAG: AAA family ATPase [Planctomycetota bacterium]|jgi:MoxR-like ATPase
MSVTVSSDAKSPSSASPSPGISPSDLEGDANRGAQFEADLACVEQLRQRLNSVLKGKSDVVELVLVCLLSRGHILIEDRPGLGKTTLARALADAVGGQFSRVQCTPDLLPGDVTGFNMFNQKTQEFDFRQGPVFADVLLADEINRATPRTQSALLEAMAERQVTVDGERYQLTPSFFVIATQNPHDQHGTYPLPEAQLDRFAMKLSIGYPGHNDEMALLASAVGSPSSQAADSSPVFESGQAERIQDDVAAVAVVSSLHDYLVRLAAATRSHSSVELGLSPRGLLTLQRCAQALAWLDGRRFATPDDVQAAAPHVLTVRLVVDAEDPAPVIREIISSVSVPSE